jgi:hypothetical protein
MVVAWDMVLRTPCKLGFAYINGFYWHFKGFLAAGRMRPANRLDRWRGSAAGKAVAIVAAQARAQASS